MVRPTIPDAKTRGPAPAAGPVKEGFGSRVLEATLGNQLGGTIARQWPPAGLLLEASLPLDRVRA
jgi:hypothetical protein